MRAACDRGACMHSCRTGWKLEISNKQINWIAVVRGGTLLGHRHIGDRECPPQSTKKIISFTLMKMLKLLSRYYSATALYCGSTFCESVALHRCLWSLFEGSHQSCDTCSHTTGSHVQVKNYMWSSHRSIHCYVLRVSLPFLLGVYNGADGSYSISRHSPSNMSTSIPTWHSPGILLNLDSATQ